MEMKRWNDIWICKACIEFQKKRPARYGYHHFNDGEILSGIMIREVYGDLVNFIEMRNRNT